MSIIAISPRSSRYLILLVKLAVVLVFAYLLYHSFSSQENLSDLYILFRNQINRDRVGYLIGALILVYLNWWLEAQKWRKLMIPVLMMDTSQAFRAVLIGLTTSIFTPNRIGEYIGRIIVVEHKKKLAAMSVLGFGSLIQLLVLSFLGIISLAYLVRHSYPVPYADFVSWGLILILTITVSLILFNFTIIFNFLKVKFGSYFSALWIHFEFLTHLPGNYFRPILALTCLRVGIYVGQYWLLIKFFHIDAPVDLAAATILLGYFIQSGLPLPSLFALMARGEITLLLWNFFSVNELSILAASYGLWVINVVLPALVGMIYVIRIKTNSA